MSGIPTWDKIISPLGSTTTEFGGNWANLISDYFNGVNISLSDANKAPLIGTITRYKYEKLSLLDVDASHSLLFSVDDIDTGPTRKIRFRRMNTPFEEDFAVLEGLPQAILNKTIDGDLNTITNISGSSLKPSAGIPYSSLSLTNSILLSDLASNSVNSAKIVDDSIVNADVNTAAGILTTKLADSVNFVLTTRTNSFGDFNQVFKDNRLLINNPADTFAYTIIGAAIGANRNLTLPLLTGNDTVVTEAFIQALTNKTINADSNTITNIEDADIKAGANIVTTKLADSANFLLKTLDNSFGAHYHDITKMTAPSNPAVNDVRIYVDTADTHLKLRNNAGTVIDLHAVAAGSLGGLTDVDLITTPPANNNVLTYTTTGSKWVPAAPPGAGGGEANTSSNSGTGEGTLAQAKVGVNLPFKSLKQGTGISLTNNTNDVTITATTTGEANTTSNSGTGEGTLALTKSGVNLPFKTLKQGSNITLTNNASDVTISSTATGGTVTPSSVDTFTNKTINADGTGNSITNIEDADIKAAAGIVTTKLADSANFILKTLDNSFGAHYEDFTKMTAPGNPGINDIRLYVDTADTHIKIKNNAGTVVDLHSAGSGVTASSGDTFTNKTINLTNNIVQDTSRATGDIPKDNGTKYVRLPRGSANQFLKVNTGGTDVGYEALDVTLDTNAITTTNTKTLTNKTINGLDLNLASKTATYTATVTDDIIPCAPAADMIINLPAAATATAGKVYTIQKTNSNAFTVTIDPATSELINGAATLVLTTQYQSVTIYTDGSAWYSVPFSTERRGLSQASGTGAAVTFNIPHGLGVTPHDVLIQCSSFNTAFTYTLTTTNIVVVFATAPTSGTNNVIFHWSAVP
jgi:hypothetical protein